MDGIDRGQKFLSSVFRRLATIGRLLIFVSCGLYEYAFLFVLCKREPRNCWWLTDDETFISSTDCDTVNPSAEYLCIYLSASLMSSCLLELPRYPKDNESFKLTIAKYIDAMIDAMIDGITDSALSIDHRH